MSNPETKRLTHAGALPAAPHLRQTSTGKRKPDRVWAEVELPDDTDWQSEADKGPRPALRYARDWTARRFPEFGIMREAATLLPRGGNRRSTV